MPGRVDSQLAKQDKRSSCASGRRPAERMAASVGEATEGMAVPAGYGMAATVDRATLATFRSEATEGIAAQLRKGNLPLLHWGCRGMVADRLRRPQADRWNISAAAEGDPSLLHWGRPS